MKSQPNSKLKQRLERETLRAQIEHSRLRTKTAKQVSRQMNRGMGTRLTNYNDSYDSTIRTRLRPGYRSRPGLHNQHLDASTHETLRRDARALDRNNPLARALIQRLIDSVVGRGFNMQSQADDPEWQKLAEAKWKTWWEEEVDVQGLALGNQFDRVILRSIAVDGDVGILRLENGQLQLVESDRIRTPADRRDDRNYVDGVELDKIGRPAAFHVAETAGGASFMLGFSKSTRIPAEYFDFLTNPIHQRTNQTRGEPVLAATMTLLEQLDDLIDSRVVSRRLQSYIALAIETEDPAGVQQSMIDQAQAAAPGIADGYNTGEAQPQKWEPGGVIHLKKGEKISPIAPEAAKDSLDAETAGVLRFICSDIGLPIVLSMFNSSDTTYHGFKAEIMTAWRGFIRWIEMLAREKRRLYRWRVGMWIYNGELPSAKNWEKVKVGIPPLPMIDPKAEGEAAAAAINQSLRSRRDVIAELFGDDLDDLYAQLEYERKTEREKGIGPVAMPGQQAPVAQGTTSESIGSPPAKSGKTQAA